jgi:hypothetical protein
MELDRIDPATPRIVSSQLRRVLVGEPAEPQASPKATRTSASAASTPLTFTASSRGRLVAIRFTSPKGGVWLRTSWVSNECMAIAPQHNPCLF